MVHFFKKTSTAAFFSTVRPKIGTGWQNNIVSKKPKAMMMMRNCCEHSQVCTLHDFIT